MTNGPSWKRRAGRLLLVVGIVALLGVSIFGVFLSNWSEVRVADRGDALSAFDEALAALPGSEAYVFIDPGGEVHVRRDLEQPEPADLDTLHVLAWSAQRERLVDVGFPMWFVRMKMSGGLDLGTLTSFLAGDWKQLDLSISLDDLKRRGPGLVLDHARADGARIVVWTE